MNNYSIDTQSKYRIVTPPACVLWANLDDAQSDRFGKHSISLAYNKDEWAPFVEKLEDFTEHIGLGTKIHEILKPVSPWNAQHMTCVEEGDYCLRFNTGSYAQRDEDVPVFDVGAGKGFQPAQLDRRIWSGDRVKATVTLKAWEYDDRSGLSMWLDNVIVSGPLPTVPVFRADPEAYAQEIRELGL